MEGVRPRPGLPPEPTGPLPDGRETHGFPGDQVPFNWADGGVLGPGGRPSFSVFKELNLLPDAPARLPRGRTVVRLPGRGRVEREKEGGVPGHAPRDQTIARLLRPGAFRAAAARVGLAAAAAERQEAELRQLLRVDAVVLLDRQLQHRHQALTLAPSPPAARWRLLLGRGQLRLRLDQLLPLRRQRPELLRGTIRCPRSGSFADSA